MTASALFLQAAMDLIEPGWVLATSDRGIVAVTKGAERITYCARFNGGDPRYFLDECPERLLAAVPLPWPCPPEKGAALPPHPGDDHGRGILAHRLGPGEAWIEHAACGRRSHNAEDVKNRYCGFCAMFLDKSGPNPT